MESFSAYLFDFYTLIGFFLVTRHPEWLAALIVQNGNLYEEGLLDGACDFIAPRREQSDAEQTTRDLLTLLDTCF